MSADLLATTGLADKERFVAARLFSGQLQRVGESTADRQVPRRLLLAVEPTGNPDSHRVRHQPPAPPPGARRRLWRDCWLSGRLA